jgi:Cu/Ag efflux protein CusF
MRMTGIAVSTIVALCLASAAYAQEIMKGKVTAVDPATGKVSISQTSGTMGSGSAAPATEYKVEDGLMLNAVKPGDEVSFTADDVDGVKTIKNLTKD